MENQGPPPKIVNQSRYVSGISDFPKEGLDPFVYQDGISIDHRHDPRAITLLPRSLKESGSTIIDLPMWASIYPTTIDTYIYGNTGNIYKRTTTPSYSNLHKSPSSHGNGLFYYPEDDYLYYTGDSAIGRYGPISLSSPQFVDDFLTAQGGVPTNTYSLQLLSASSQYASHVDGAAYDITGNISLGCQINPTTLPTVGNSMTLVAKWNEQANTRSYKLDIYGISGYFGDGSNGALTISSNTTDAPTDSACTGTAGTQTLSATNAAFVAGQVILIHQTQGTNAGQWERNTIQGYTAGTITLQTALIGSYTTGAQVIVMKQYTNVTINSGKTLTAKAWNGTVGGILAFLANGTVTVTGNISANATGFRGGAGGANGILANPRGQAGEGTPGIGSTTAPDNSYANGNGGGGAQNGSSPQTGEPGGGGGNGTGGDTGHGQLGGAAGVGGNAVGSTDLTTALFGGGGGGAQGNNDIGGPGGNGGGIVFISGTTITVSGGITSTGADNGAGDTWCGGGAAGGSILLKGQVLTLGASLITAAGGSGGSNGGAGGVGRIAINYLTSYTGTTSPTLNALQDSSLVTNLTYQARLGISNDGTAFEYLTQNLPTLAVSVWNQLSVSWVASTSTATFFLNSVAIGTSVGTKTAISNNASAFTVGANNSGAGIGNYFNGLIDEAMVFNTVTTAAFWLTALTAQIPVNTAGLKAYYQFNNSPNDSTANANNLTLVNTPTYSQSVPFAGATTRLDIDQTQIGTGNTYTTLTAISESASDYFSFTPLKDPQKSIQVAIAAIGTGNWTVTVHDSANHLITSVTVANANLHTGNYEFVFATPWRTLTNFTNTYHVHITSTVADGTITTGTASNLSTAGFTTYFSFLVTDTAFHPISQMLNQMVIGNERYLATYNGIPASYNPNYLVLPAAWRIRCFALWNEYLAIGVMRGSAITDFDQGRIYFWDGSALTFNFFIDVPEGGVNALLSRGSTLYAWCGYTGYLFEYQTGLDGDKIKRIPHILENDTCEIFPGAVSTWRTLVRFGVGGNVSSSNINRGVYSWGSFLTMGFFQQLYRDSLSFDYPISTGNYGSTVKIGLTQPVQNQLLIGWQDGTAYGIDNVSFDNPYAATGSISLLVSDDGDVYKQKSSTTILIQHLPLASGESIQAKYSQDRATYQVSGYNSTVGSTKTPIIITGQLYNEYQIGADLTTSTGLTTPTITGIAIERDTNEGAVKLQTA
jgi:hypothetical protein